MTGEHKAIDTITQYFEIYPSFGYLCEALEQDYVRLFISDRNGITASLHQSNYDSEDGRLMGRPAKMMASRLKASGWRFRMTGLFLRITCQWKLNT